MRPLRLRPARRAWALVVVAVTMSLVALACDGSGPTTTTTTTTTSTTTAPVPDPSLAAPCGRAEEPPPRYDHVVVLVEENRTWTGGRSAGLGMGFDALTMPFLHGLAAQCAYFTDWAETNGAQN